MRSFFVRLFVLAGCIFAMLMASLPSAPAQPVLAQRPTLTAAEQNVMLKKAKEQADTSKMTKKGKFTVGNIPNVSDKPRKQLAGTNPPPPEQLRKEKLATKGAQARPPLRKVPLDKPFDLRQAIGSRDFPIQNQGSCGSCWIFGAVAATEGNILFKGIGAATPPSIGMAEQYVLDRWLTLGNGDPCAGGWFADSLGVLRDEGTATRTQIAYAGRASNRNRLTNPPFKVKSFGYVGNDEGLVPDREEIKQAIATYGAVVVAVYVGDAFQNYQSGIFGIGTPEPAPGENDVNHAVTLVGWDESLSEFNDPEFRRETGGGVWILRNSWGIAWGENGYMRIAYSSSNVGYGAMWVDADVPSDPCPPCPACPDRPAELSPYTKAVQDRIKFYEQNYPNYLKP